MTLRDNSLIYSTNLDCLFQAGSVPGSGDTKQKKAGACRGAQCDMGWGQTPDNPRGDTVTVIPTVGS